MLFNFYCTTIKQHDSLLFKTDNKLSNSINNLVTKIQRNRFDSNFQFGIQEYNL